jgi:hypothetical protein
VIVFIFNQATALISKNHCYSLLFGFICQAQLYKMYEDESNAFGGHYFLEFQQLCKFKHEQIRMVWEVDMNENKQILALSIEEMKILAKNNEKPMT